MLHEENRNKLESQSFQQTQFRHIEKMLHRAGKLAEHRRLRGFSLGVIERETIFEARKIAQLFGLSSQIIFSMEQEGAKGARS